MTAGRSLSFEATFPRFYYLFADFKQVKLQITLDKHENIYRGFLYLTFTCFSSVFYGIFEQLHVQVVTTVGELCLNFLSFLSLLSRKTEA